jgi:hypothetical protein
MDYHSIANPAWADAEHTMISIDIVFPTLGDTPVKFNASPKDVMPHGRAIYAELIAGNHGAIAELTTTSQ